MGIFNHPTMLAKYCGPSIWVPFWTLLKQVKFSWVIANISSCPKLIQTVRRTQFLAQLKKLSPQIRRIYITGKNKTFKCNTCWMRPWWNFDLWFRKYLRSEPLAQYSRTLIYVTLSVIFMSSYKLLCLSMSLMASIGRVQMQRSLFLVHT